MKAFTYVRVSTTSQDLSPDVQRSQLAAYCAMKGYEIVPMPDEIGVSGSVPFAERPVGKAMIERLQEVDALVFSKLDRAFRDVVDCLLTTDQFRAAGKAVHFLDMGVDTSTPAGALCLTMMAAFAAFERRRIGERIKEALATAKTQGKRIGPAPFGSRNLARMVDGKKVDGGRHEPLDTEQGVVASILRARFDGQSFREIALCLNTKNIPARKGGKWHPETVAGVVRRSL